MEVRISRHGGDQPAWSPDGSELYYRRGQMIVALPYTVEGERFVPGKETTIFESSLLSETEGPLIVREGRRFLVTLLEEEPGPPDVKVVLNWNLEVARRFESQR